MPIGPTLEIQEDLQVILTGVEDNTQEILDGERGDITVSSSGTVWTIDNNAVTTVKINNSAVTNAKLANMATATVKGRATAGTGDPEDLAIDSDLSTTSANNDTIPSAKAVKDYVDLLELKTRIRNAGLLNGYIIPSVASNNLTLAVSTSPSSVVAPTSTNPVYVWIGNTLRSITSSLSISANAGTNWFNAGSSELATREIDYFAYIGYNATDGVVLGFARIPYARLYSDFNTTTTNERYARISTITNAASGDNYINVGRFAATLSAGAGHTWTVPSFTNANLIQEPIYETRWMLATLAPEGDGGSLGTFTQDTTFHKYKIRYNNCLLQTTGRVTNKGSWTGTVRMKIPISASKDTGDVYWQSGWSPNNGNPITSSRAGAKASNSVYATWVSNIYNAALNWSAVVNNDTYWFNGEYEI